MHYIDGNNKKRAGIEDRRWGRRSATERVFKKRNVNIADSYAGGAESRDCQGRYERAKLWANLHADIRVTEMTYSLTFLIARLELRCQRHNNR
jgi:hypothetical protein